MTTAASLITVAETLETAIIYAHCAQNMAADAPNSCYSKAKIFQAIK